MLEIGFPERSPSTSPWCVAGHPAGLNFGDCFAYALASVTGEPLLSKGEDFGHPDVRVA